MKENNRVVIIGAGIAGCFLALELAKSGRKVVIFEKDSKTETISAASKRSFNITIYGYGLNILKNAGLLPYLKKSITKLKGYVTFIGNNPKPVISYVHRKSPYYAVQRADLLNVLIKQAQSTKNVTVHFEHEFVSVNKSKKTVTVKDLVAGKKITLKTSLLVGCDGVNSKVREALLLEKKAKLNKKYSKWGYKQIIFTHETVKKLSMNTKYAYTWSSKDAVIATFPNYDMSSTAMLILPQKNNKKDLFSDETFIKNLVIQGFPTLLPALKTILRQVKENPMGSFVTIHTSPWHYKDFIVLMGDAAHGFYPFFGQGISAAIGDANTLLRLLQQENDQEKALQKFELLRKRHMDTLGELSKGGFELYRRHKKANYKIIYNRLETLIHQFLPFVSPSVFESIHIDQARTDDYVIKHTKQRKLARFLGVPLAVYALTVLYAIYELIMTSKFMHRVNKRPQNYIFQL